MLYEVITLDSYLPIWKQLTKEDQAALEAAATFRSIPKGTIIHNGSADCIGVLVIRGGQLRSYIVSDEGKEVTLYRLLERDICLFSAACMMSSIRFEVTIETEKDSEVWLLQTEAYHAVLVITSYSIHYTKLYDSCGLSARIRAASSSGMMLTGKPNTWRYSKNASPSERVQLLCR